MTPRDYIEDICQLVPDEPITPGLTLQEAEQRLEQSVQLADNAQILDAYSGVREALTPRRQLRQVLKNTAFHVDSDWNGREAIQDAVGLVSFTASAMEIGPERTVRALVFGLAARVHAMSVLPEIALCRPHDRSAFSAGGTFPAWHLTPRGAPESTNVLQLRLRRTLIPAGVTKLRVYFNEWDQFAPEDRGLNAAIMATEEMAREVALELNLMGLRRLLETAPERYGEERSGMVSARQDRFRNAVDGLFLQCHGTPTHVIAGANAWQKLIGAGVLSRPEPVPNPMRFPGLVQFACQADGVSPSTKFFVANFWSPKDADTLLLVHNVPHTLEGALAYCPYRWGLRMMPIPAESQKALGLVHESALDVVEQAFAAQTRLT